MINTKTIACAALVAVVSAGGAVAQTFQKYGEAGGWTVFANPDDKTCLTETRRGDLLAQMGVLKNGLGYIGAFTKEDGAVSGETGNEFIIDVDGQLFVGKETVMRGNTQGYSGAYIKADNPNFIADIENKQTMKVIDADRVFTLDLTGTKAAIALARECLASME